MVRGLLFTLVAVFANLAGELHAAPEAGQSVPLRSATELRARPVADSEVIAPVAAGATAALVSRSVNAGGAWWYASVDGRKGWLAESVLGTLAAAPAAPAPAPELQPVPGPAPVAAVAPPSTPAVAAPPDDSGSMLTAAGSLELELNLQVSRTKFDGEQQGTEILSQVKLGHMITNNHEVGALAEYFKGDDIKGFGLGPFYTLNLPSPPSNVVPYFGVSAVYQRIDLDGFGSSLEVSGRALEGWAGTRVFAGDNLAVNINLYYRKTRHEYEGGGFSFSDVDTTTYGLRVGLSGFLR